MSGLMKLQSPEFEYLGACYFFIMGPQLRYRHKFEKVKKGIFLALVFLLFIPLQGQTVAGRVVDMVTGEPLRDANVILEGTTLGDAADSDGRFVIEGIPAGDHTLHVTMVGYRRESVSLHLTDSSTESVIVRLTPEPLEGGLVIAEGERGADPRLEFSVPSFELTRRSIEEMSGTLGDALTAVQSLPGILTTDDLSNTFVVPGGSPDQNLILIDGMELFNPYRRSGMASPFNPRLVSEIRVFTAGFPAMYGDRLSSVLEATTRDGTTDRPFAGTVAATTYHTNIILEGKLPYDGSWLVSGRKSYYGTVGRTVAAKLKIGNELAFPTFEDLYAKVALHPKEGQRIEITLLSAYNNMDFLVKPELGEQDGERGTIDGADRMWNQLAGIRWHTPLSDFIQVGFYLNGYHYGGKSDFASELLPLDDPESSIPQGFGVEPPLPPPTFGAVDTIRFNHHQTYSFERISLGGWSIIKKGDHVMELGGSFDGISATMASDLELNEFGQKVREALVDAPLWFGTMMDSMDIVSDYSRFGAYVQDSWTPQGGRFTFAPGLRIDRIGLSEELLVSPRIRASLETAAGTVRAAGGRFVQSPGYEKFLDGSRVFDLMQYRTLEGLISPFGWHASVGFERKNRRGFNLALEGFRKNFEKLITRKADIQSRLVGDYHTGPPALSESYDVVTAMRFQPALEAENGSTVDAVGLQGRLEKRRVTIDDRWTGWISYTFSRAEEERMAQGALRRFPFEYDRRHSLSMGISVRLGRGLTVSSRWQYGSGFPYTPAISMEPMVGQAVDDLDSTTIRNIILSDPETGYARFVPTFGGPENFNSARYPAYHRLDVRLEYDQSIKERVNLKLTFDLLNAYNRKNVLEYRSIINIEGGEEHIPLSLQFPKPVLYYEPIYTLLMLPTFGIEVSF